jgi:hypothetical protein
MEVPLDTQSSGSHLDVDIGVKNCHVVVGVLHVLAWFVLVLHEGNR